MEIIDIFREGRFERGAKARMQRLAAYLSYLVREDHTTKYVYVSHHKCATQYARRILQDVCTLRKIPISKYTLKRGGKRALLFHKFIMFLDYDSNILDIKSIKCKGIHVIRDPRDILTSMYFSHRDSHSSSETSEIFRNRQVLRKLGRDDGLRYLMDESTFFRRVIFEMGSWDYHMENFYETTFERITTNSLSEFETIFRFLNIEVETIELNEILEKNSFSLLQREFSQYITHKGYGWAQGNHYRRGKAGDWKNQLHGENKAIFKERYGDLLIKLGYERGDDW